MRWRGLSFLCPLVFFASLNALSNNYYFSSTSGDDSRTSAQAQHPDKPWMSINKLNDFFPNLRPGDSILFQRGSTFIGSIRITSSGDPSRPIVFGAYGTGNPPVITGFTTLTSWTSIGKGLWKAACPSCGSTVNMVTIDGTPHGMGRTPNPDEQDGGFFTIQGHTKTQTLNGDNLEKGPDWTGAEIVIRKNRFILDKGKVTSQSGNTLGYKTGSFYEPTDKFGYFIQNDIRTLDQKGEWYYDPKVHFMNIYFGNDDPSKVAITASSVDNLVIINNQKNLVFTGISFLGSNLDVFSLSGAENITVLNSSIVCAGLNGVKGVKVSKITIRNVDVMNSNNNGIDINGAGNLIDGNRVSKTGLIPGMGTGEASYIGINMGGSNNTVQYNQVSSTGYVAIFFLGTDNLIKNNVVQNFALVKDDGGGIYTWSGDIDTSVQRHTGIITGNIVLDGITAPNGTDKKQGAIAYGIYLDENSGMIEVSGNTVSRCKGGIFLQDAHEVTVTGNTFFDNGFQIALRNPQKKGTLRNNHISNNIAVAKSRDQFVLILSSAVSDNINGYAEFDNNRYCQPTGSQNSFFKVVTRSLSGSSTQGGSLDKWKSDYGNDKGSQIIYAGDPPRFEYNPDARPKTVNLQGSYNDISGKTYQGSISLAPFSSVLLFK